MLLTLKTASQSGVVWPISEPIQAVRPGRVDTGLTRTSEANRLCDIRRRDLSATFGLVTQGRRVRYFTSWDCDGMAILASSSRRRFASRQSRRAA